jgi:chromosome segregation ATPase
MRDEWDNEVHAHEALRADWAREREEILSLRAELERDRENWKREHVAQAQRHQEEEVEWEREIQAHADLRADWVRAGSDIMSLRAELQHQKAEWEHEHLAQVERRQKEEVEWDKAHEALRADWARKRDDVEALRADLQREKAEWERQRAAEKRRREEEHARARAEFRWEDLTPNQRCLRHNARGYTARLANVPRSYDPVQACMETAIKIPGVKIKGRPLKCDDRVRHLCECSISNLILA